MLDSERPSGGIELIIVDGMSEDGTREILSQLASEHQPLIRVLDNPPKAVPHAMNLAIRAASGKIIVRLDAHTYYEKDYIRQCVYWLESSEADNVGGVLIAEPSEDTLLGRALSKAVCHPFGSGNAHHKTGVVTKPREVDTVAFGCFRRELFDRIGFFREDLARSSDMEFNIRIRRMGGRILLVPAIRSHYQVRSRLKRVIPYYFSNGFWVLFPLKFGATAFKLRHLIPFFFVSWLLVFGTLAFFLAAARFAFLAAVAAYLLCAFLSGLHVALRERRAEFTLTLPAAFSLGHIVQGLGSLYAGACLLLELLLPARLFRKATPDARV